MGCLKGKRQEEVVVKIYCPHLRGHTTPLLVGVSRGSRERRGLCAFCGQWHPLEFVRKQRDKGRKENGI